MGWFRATFARTRETGTEKSSFMDKNMIKLTLLNLMLALIVVTLFGLAP